MGQETRVKEFADLLFGEPLEPATERELKAQHGPAMEKARRLLHRALARQRAADLAVSCVRRAGSAALRVVNRIGDVAINFADGIASSIPAPAYATRALGAGSAPGAHAAGVDRVEATKEGDGARLKVTIENPAGRCDVRICLEDIATCRTLKPLELYIEDREDGRTLLEKTVYASGEAALRDVEQGEYWIEAASGGKSAEMALRIECAARQ